jgi:hypothetical protein
MCKQECAFPEGIYLIKPTLDEESIDILLN